MNQSEIMSDCVYPLICPDSYKAVRAWIKEVEELNRWTEFLENYEVDNEE